jgi:hypothetical protein
MMYPLAGAFPFYLSGLWLISKGSVALLGASREWAFGYE